MNPRYKPKPKPSVRAIEGIEKCPQCGALQELKDQFMTVNVAGDMVTWWICHACGHEFRIWRDQVLEAGWWPARNKDGTYGLVMMKISKINNPKGFLLRRVEMKEK